MAGVVLPADLTAARAGRRHLEAVCRDLGVSEAVLDAARVLVSELVTNAVVHGGSSPRLRVEAGGGGALWVGVGDDDDRHPVARDQDDGALGGRGLRLLDGLASRWGVRPDPPGKVIWFEVDAEAG